MRVAFIYLPLIHMNIQTKQLLLAMIPKWVALLLLLVVIYYYYT